MRRAILTVALVCGTLFIVVSYVTELAHPGTGFRDPQSAVDEIAHAVGGNFLKVLFIAGILTTQAAGGVAMQTTVARLLYAMGRDGVLPRPFAYLHPRFKTPVFNLALTGLIGLVGLIVTVETATTFINFGAFVAFTFVNLSVIAHAWKTRRQRRTGRDGFMAAAGRHRRGRNSMAAAQSRKPPPISSAESGARSASSIWPC